MSRKTLILNVEFEVDDTDRNVACYSLSLSGL
jgi:hypothetical protein